MFAENVSGVHRQKRNVLSSRLKQLRLAYRCFLKFYVVHCPAPPEGNPQ